MADPQFMVTVRAAGIVLGALASLLGALTVIKLGFDKVFGLEFKTKTRKIADKNIDRLDAIEPAIRRLENEGRIQTESLGEVKENLREIKGQNTAVMDLLRNNSRRDR